MKFLFLIAAIIAFPLLAQAGQEGPVRNVTPPMPIEQMIQKVAAAETANKLARQLNYTFTQDYDLKTLGIGGFISGEFHRVSDIVYDDHDNRLEQITFFPQSTAAVTVTPEDINDAAGVQPFALTLENVPKYDITYIGKQKQDELDTYVFDVKPKRIEKGKRYFDGRIWVDDHDLQIVMTKGQAVPRTPTDAYPHFTSYRENIDGKYWFPTYVYADDVLDFKNAPSVHIQMTIRYTKYKKFTGNIRVVDAGGGEDDVPPAAKPTPKPPQKPPLDF